jgi:glucan 1,3-beta-glucosidase
MPGYQATVVLDNVNLEGNVKATVLDSDGKIILPGESKMIKSWALGRRYTDDYPNGVLMVGDLPPPTKDKSLLYGSDRFFEQQKPQYFNKEQSDFLSVLWFGAKNDGVYPNSNTLSINKALEEAARLGKILVFPAGVYKVDDTLYIPPESKIVGVLWSQIMAVGKNFEDMTRPKALVK